MSSVRLSVTLVDCNHIWNSSKIISRLVSVGRSFSADPIDLLHWEQLERETPLNLGPKWPTPCWFERWRHSTIANCGRTVTDSATVDNGELIRNHAALSNGTIHHWPLRPPLQSKWESHMPQWYANGHISATNDPIHFMFGSRVEFSWSMDRMALCRVISNPRWRPAAILLNFEWPHLRKGSCYPLRVKILW